MSLNKSFKKYYVLLSTKKTKKKQQQAGMTPLISCDKHFIIILWFHDIETNNFGILNELRQKFGSG